MLFVANIAVIIVLLIAWIWRLAYEKFTATKRKVDETARTIARGSAIEMSTPPGRLNRFPRPVSAANPIALAQARLYDGEVVEEGDEEEGAGGAVVTVTAAELKISELEAEVKEVNLEVARLREENEKVNLEVARLREENNDAPGGHTLPPDWFSHQDDAGREYFYHEITRETSYERPSLATI